MRNESKTAISSQTKARVRRHFQQFPCGSQYAGAPEGSRSFFTQAIAARYSEYAPWLLAYIYSLPVRGKRVLEVGCGMGLDALEFARGGARVTGIDLVPRHVKLARKLFSTCGIRGNFLTADAEKLPFPKNSFDVVYSHGVLHHTPNARKAILEILRVLRPTGKAYIMLYNRDSLAFWTKVFYYGILKRNLLHESLDELASHIIEYGSETTRPLVKVYSRKEILHLFKGFRVQRLCKQHLMNEARMRFLRKIIPAKVLRALEHALGWYWVIEVQPLKLH